MPHTFIGKNFYILCHFCHFLRTQDKSLYLGSLISQEVKFLCGSHISLRNG